MIVVMLSRISYVLFVVNEFKLRDTIGVRKEKTILLTLYVDILILVTDVYVVYSYA